MGKRKKGERLKINTTHKSTDLSEAGTLQRLRPNSPYFGMENVYTVDQKKAIDTLIRRLRDLAGLPSTISVHVHGQRCDMIACDRRVVSTYEVEEIAFIEYRRSAFVAGESFFFEDCPDLLAVARHFLEAHDDETIVDSQDRSQVQGDADALLEKIWNKK